MIAVDSNVVVRLLSRDEEEQFQRAYQLFREHDVFIATTVILECEWVLRYAYRMSPEAVIAAMRRLFGLENVVLEELNRVALALDWQEQGMDFADALHYAATPEGSDFITFDRKLVAAATRLAVGHVREP